MIAGRNDVGFHHIVVRRRSFRTVTCNSVVDAGRSVCRLHGAHGDDLRIIPWSGDGAVAFCSRGVVAPLVPSRGQHYYACIPSCLNCLAEWIQLIAFVDLAPERKADYTDVVSRFQVDGSLDRRNHTAVGTSTVLVQNAQVDDVCIRGNPFECVSEVGTGGKPARTGNDPSHMCSVAILVGAIRCARNKVLAIDNARAISLIRRNPPIEITNGGDAAINDRYSDARAIQTPPLPRDGCIDLFLRRSRESKYR